MTAHKQSCIADLILAALVSAGAAILFIGAAELPPPRFEPLGSAALPRILGGLLFCFAAVLALRAISRLKAAAPSTLTEQSHTNPRQGVAVFVALVAYVFALDVLRIPFVPATTAFVLAVGLSIGARTPRNIAVFLALGLILSVAISTIFSRFLYITIG